MQLYCQQLKSKNSLPRYLEMNKQALIARNMVQRHEMF